MKICVWFVNVSEGSFFVCLDSKQRLISCLVFTRAMISMYKLVNFMLHGLGAKWFYVSKKEVLCALHTIAKIKYIIGLIYSYSASRSIRSCNANKSKNTTIPKKILHHKRMVFWIMKKSTVFLCGSFHPYLYESLTLYSC